MNNSTQNSNDVRSARRRLIKGGFSVPAVLTVASGSAMARTSSGCIAREAVQGTTPPVSGDASTAAGTYVRVAALTYLPNGANKTRSWWISYASLAAVASASGVTISGSWISAGGALCVEGGTAGGPGPYVSGVVYTGATSPNVPVAADLHTAAADGQAPRYYAVLFNTAGDIIGISQRFTASGQTGGAVNTSCWTSFTPA